MVNEAIGIGADLAEFSLLAALGDDGICGVLARLVLRPLGFFGGVRPFWPNLYVLVARNGCAVFRLLPVSGADLHELGFRCDGGLYVRLNLRGVTGGVGALCGIWENCKSFLLALRRRSDRVRRETD